MKTSGKTLYDMSKTVQRESAKNAGFYDGRFRTRSVLMEKFRKPKHKNKVIQLG